jgi:hypothetical protein
LFPRWPPGPAWRGIGGAGACLLAHSKRVAFRTNTASHSVNETPLLPYRIRRHC